MDEMRHRILLIEDDRVDQMAFQPLVKERGLPYDYAIAGSVSEAKKNITIRRIRRCDHGLSPGGRHGV